jgi:hypothetical protein
MPDDLTPKAPIQEKPPTIEQMVKQMNNSFKASEMDAPPIQQAPARVPMFSQGPEPSDDQLMNTLGIQIEKPPERAGGTTFMGKIFDVLSTGEFASAPVVRDYILGKPFNPKNITKGLTHEVKYGYGDMTEEMFPEWSPWKRKSLGFLLSITLDPVTWLPAGILAKPFKLGYKALKETEIGGKMIESAGKSKLAKAFVPGAGLPKDYYETKYYAKKGLTAEHARIFQDIEELGKGLNADDMKKLTYYREHPDEMKNIPIELKAKLEEIGTRFDALADNAAKEGLITPETAAKWKAAETPYVPHYYPDRPGGVNIVKGQLPPSMFEKIKKPGFVKPRVIKTVEDARVMSGQFDELSKVSNLPEAQKLIEKYGLGKDVASIKEIGLMKSQAAAMAKWYKPEENALKALAYRSMEQANTIARDKFMGDVLTQFGVKVKSTTKIVPEGMGLFYPKGAIRMYAKDVIPADKLEKLMEVEGDLIPAEMLEDLVKTMPSITTRVPKYMLPQSIASDLKGANSFMGADPATQGMLRVFDKITNYWKGMATSVRLPFHLRNMQSNIFQSYLAGVKNPKRFTDALMVQKSFVTKGNGVVTLGKKTYTYTELKRMIEDLGVHGKGWMAGDINKATTDELDAILKYGKLRKATPFSVGRMVGTAFEDNARIAVFMDSLAKGKSPKDASRVVRKYLFDYTELTDFEKGTMKRIIPFYCVSDDTECLSVNGWKKHNELQIGEMVLTYNLKTKTLEWKPVQGIFSAPYDYKMFSFKGKSIDLLCTFDHKCVTSKGLRDAFTVSQGDTVPMKIDYSKEDFDIPDRILSIIAWVVTDGYSRHRGNSLEAMIYQKKSIHLESIKELLGNDCTEFIHPDTGVSCLRIIGETRKAVAKYYTDKQSLWNLFVQLSPRQMKLCKKIMMDAEGCGSYENTTRSFEHFAQEGKDVLDVFQLITILSGTISNISSRGLYIRNKPKAKYPKPEIVDYNGVIWCPKTENETWVSRRNGKVVVTGNTWMRKNVPLQAESLVTNPRKYQGYGKALNAARTPETPEEAALKPEYFDKMMYIKTPWKSEKGNPLYMSIDLPANEFNKVADTGYYFVNSMHPLKAIIEVSANFTTFPKVRPIQKRPLEMTEAPIWLGYLPSSVFQMLERRGLVGPMISEKAGDRVLGVDKKFLYALHSTLPFLNEMDKTISTPVLLDDEMPKYKALSYMTGTQIQPLDKDKQLLQKVQQQKQTIQNFKETVKQRGQLPTPQMLKKLKAD